MKKNKKIIILLLILFLPIIVKADMAAPMSSYEIRISNPEGADTYEWNSESKIWEKTGKKLNYDEIYKVMYENVLNNELYGDVGKKIVNDDGTITYSNTERIKLADAKPLEVNLQDYKQSNKSKYYVFDDSCYLYNGPSELYGKIETEISLSIGTVIETEYSDEMWAYVEYNGIKGWVYKYTYSKYSSLHEPSGMTYIYNESPYIIRTMNDINLYASPKTEEEIGTTIPSGTDLNIISIYSFSPHSPNYLVEYNGVKGWINTVREEDIFNSEGTIMSIAFSYKGNAMLEVKNENGITMYSEANNVDTEIGTIPYQTKLTPTYYLDGAHSTSWYLIEYNGTKGWISGVNYKDVSFYNEEIIDNNNDEILEDDIITDSNENIETTRSSIITTIIYYICGALILSLTAVITIILINKKKKEKNVTQ